MFPDLGEITVKQGKELSQQTSGIGSSVSDTAGTKEGNTNFYTRPRKNINKQYKIYVPVSQKEKNLKTLSRSFDNY